jgi:hypothetical protein
VLVWIVDTDGHRVLPLHFGTVYGEYALKIWLLCITYNMSPIKTHNCLLVSYMLYLLRNVFLLEVHIEH